MAECGPREGLAVKNLEVMLAVTSHRLQFDQRQFIASLKSGSITIIAWLVHWCLGHDEDALA